MVRKLWTLLVLVGLAVTGGSWLLAGVMSATGTGDGFTVGLANGEKWLVNALVYPDGTVYARRFTPNLTHHRGLYAGQLRGVRPLGVWRMTNQISATVRFQLIAPAIIFGVLSAQAIGIPVLRRWRRRRNGWCIACGYDLKHAPSVICPECGHRKAVDTHSLPPQRS